MVYSNDAAGNVFSIRSLNENGAAMFYSYDALNRVTNVFDPHNGSTAYSFDATGNVESYRYPNGVLTAMAYDAVNRVTNVFSVNQQFAPLSGFSYRRGPAGHKLSVAELSGRNIQYSYDAAYSLTNELIAAPIGQPAGLISYVLDDVGNRLGRNSSVAGITTTTDSYDSNDRLTRDSYDANGNTISSGGNTDAYDFEDHLISRNNGQVKIVYDGDGNRVRETVDGISTFYLVDDRNPTGYAQVLEERTSDPANPSLITPQTTRVYIYGLDLVSQEQLTDGAWEVSFYGYDGHGNTRFLMGTDGALSDTYDYEAFGSIVLSSGATPNAHRYTGEQIDLELGLYYSRARYLNVANGRFVTRDSFEGNAMVPLSLNLYVYTHADPVNNIDPSGHSLLFDWLGSSSFAMDLRNKNDRAAFKKARRIAARLCSVTSKFVRPHNEVYEKITKGSAFQSHHIQQDALMRSLAADYKRGLEMAIALLGGSHMGGSPHDMVSRSQLKNAGRSLRFITYEGLRAAGCRKGDATEITKAAERYSKIMKWLP